MTAAEVNDLSFRLAAIEFVDGIRNLWPWLPAPYLPNLIECAKIIWPVGAISLAFLTITDTLHVSVLPGDVVDRNAEWSRMLEDCRNLDVKMIHAYIENVALRRCLRRRGFVFDGRHGTRSTDNGR